MKNFGKTVLIIWVFILVLRSFGCKKDPDVVTPQQDTIPTPAGFTLVWNDEFTGTSIDKTKWEHEVNGNGGGNNELQYYTDLEENSYVKNGILVIQALEKPYLGKKYTSARMTTRLKGHWTYGRFEIKAKLPYGQGLWPAIWMMPTDGAYGGWPQSGEIDIMELLGQEPDKIYGTIHYGSNPNHPTAGGSYKFQTGSFVGTYHIFSLEWDETGIKWFVDNVKFAEKTIGQPFDKRFFMILNVAVGGNWPGSPDLSTIFPQRMLVDYVRVFRKK